MPEAYISLDLSAGEARSVMSVLGRVSYDALIEGEADHDILTVYEALLSVVGRIPFGTPNLVNENA
jgi:hypothetical protein